MKLLLEDLDQQIAEERDKQRYHLQDKRKLTIDSLFSEIEINRTYYRDRKTNEHVYLLDRYLGFEGAKGFSPMLEEAAIELAVSGPSYRKAANTLETILGYRVMSHEAIRQHLLKVEAIQKEQQKIHSPVLFVEVDGLYIKRQEKRHYIHRGKEPFWEGFENFLMETYDYDPTVHRLVINGDGAGWITACRDYFKDRAFFSIDRFHIARDIEDYFETILVIRQCRKH